MQKTILWLCVLLLLTSGCSGSKANISLPNTDIVFQTIINKKDVLGFYSLTDNSSTIINIDTPLQFPMFFNNDYLIGTNKSGNLGIAMDYSGRLEIISRKGLSHKCDSKIRGFIPQPYYHDILFDDTQNIYILSGENCDLINTLVSHELVERAYEGSHIYSYSVSSDGKFAFLSLLFTDYKLFKIDLQNHELVDLNVIGTNPSISPDNRNVAFLGAKGIIVMDVNGSNVDIITDYVTSEREGEIGILSRVLPKPNWSADSKKITYHKCVNESGNGCMVIEDYDVYIYDLETRKETVIFHDGINPSWNK